MEGSELSELRRQLGARQIEISKREAAFATAEAAAEQRWLAMTHSVSSSVNNLQLFLSQNIIEPMLIYPAKG